MGARLNILDSLEILSFENNRNEYPTHYHDTYCVSTIRKGFFGENELVAPQGSIIISHPNEIHKNNLIENLSVSFTTFYISPNVINSISKFEHTSFQDKIIDSPILWQQLNLLAETAKTDRMHENFIDDFCASFYKTINQIACHYGQNKPYLFKEPSILLDEVRAYITDKLKSKIKLSELAHIVGMNKFQFSRWFKKKVGITPFEFILLKRIGLGKKLIQQGLPLVDVSLESGFYDQSNFSNYFKRYVGMSPNVYKQNCNIFQDFDA